MSKKIMIVDDEEDIRTLLETFLQKNGFETVSATNGNDAIELWKKEKPDLVTLDLQMPKNTGTDFYRKIRREDDSDQVPVIVISGLPGRHLAIPKPFAVFDKPIDRDGLLEKINEALGL
ncbi:MAG: response regulator [candidate division Zixibacteria bacterium]|nr:response regulator [candidate division Zixibacteria bacterium]